MPILRYDHRVELRHLLVRLSKAAGVLPTSIFLKDVECWDRDSVAGGGFADIFRARHIGQEVALKRLRVFLSSKEETASYNAVRSILSLSSVISYGGYRLSAGRPLFGSNYSILTSYLSWE